MCFFETYPIPSPLLKRIVFFLRWGYVGCLEGRSVWPNMKNQYFTTIFPEIYNGISFPFQNSYTFWMRSCEDVFSIFGVEAVGCVEGRNDRKSNVENETTCIPMQQWYST